MRLNDDDIEELKAAQAEVRAGEYVTVDALFAPRAKAPLAPRNRGEIAIDDAPCGAPRPRFALATSPRFRGARGAFFRAPDRES